MKAQKEKEPWLIPWIESDMKAPFCSKCGSPMVLATADDPPVDYWYCPKDFKHPIKKA